LDESTGSAGISAQKNPDAEINPRVRLRSAECGKDPDLPMF
jgi:hypothetical protein